MSDKEKANNNDIVKAENDLNELLKPYFEEINNKLNKHEEDRKVLEEELKSISEIKKEISSLKSLFSNNKPASDIKTTENSPAETASNPEDLKSILTSFTDKQKQVAIQMWPNLSPEEQAPILSGDEKAKIKYLNLVREYVPEEKTPEDILFGGLKTAPNFQDQADKFENTLREKFKLAVGEYNKVPTDDYVGTTADLNNRSFFLQQPEVNDINKMNIKEERCPGGDVLGAIERAKMTSIMKPK